MESKQAPRGSQKWLQILINQHPNLMDAAIRGAVSSLPAMHGVVSSLPAKPVEWVSPLEAQGYAEYQDQRFLERLGITLAKQSLSTFWPSGGPHWDGLGRIGQEAYFLVEAKSHIPEIASPPMSASAEASQELICKSLEETKQFLHSSSKADWSQIFYQYTNRLAHLYLLRQLNVLPAYLVNVHFINNPDMDGPTSCAEWKGALKLLEVYLGVSHHRMKPYVIDLCIDVNDLKPFVIGATE